MSSPIERIVVPTDFSHASEAAVDYAGELAIRLPATVHLVHVIDELLTPEIARAPANQGKSTGAGSRARQGGGSTRTARRADDQRSPRGVADDRDRPGGEQGPRRSHSHGDARPRRQYGASLQASRGLCHPARALPGADERVDTLASGQCWSGGESDRSGSRILKVVLGLTKDPLSDPALRQNSASFLPRV